MLIVFSEDDEAMDVDSGAPPKKKDDDLTEYNLDDYDEDDVTTERTRFYRTQISSKLKS